MYVQRNEEGRIVSVFSVAQPGMAEEWVEGAEIGQIPKTREQVNIDRLIAYADPITGCDRFKAEASAERLAGNEEAALAAEEKLLARREQIKAENPWPVEAVSK